MAQSLHAPGDSQCGEVVVGECQEEDKQTTEDDRPPLNWWGAISSQTIDQQRQRNQDNQSDSGLWNRSCTLMRDHQEKHAE
jgi:hypothetical protein